MAQTLGADIKHAFCTLAVYTALAVKDEGTLYNVWDEGAIYRGSTCIVRSGNTLNTSSTAQTKAGALTVSGLLTANGGLNATTGAFSGLINSTVAQGTAPISVISNTVCPNLKSEFSSLADSSKLLVNTIFQSTSFSATKYLKLFTFTSTTKWSGADIKISISDQENAYTSSELYLHYRVSDDALTVAGGANLSWLSGNPGTTQAFLQYESPGIFSLWLKTNSYYQSLAYSVLNYKLLGSTTATASSTLLDAITGSTVVSAVVNSLASKLATSRTLWGRLFDGTANISGDLADVGSLSMAGILTMANNQQLRWGSNSAMIYGNGSLGTVNIAGSTYIAGTLKVQGIEGVLTIGSSVTGATTDTPIGRISFTSDDTDYGSNHEVASIRAISSNLYGLRNDLLFFTRDQTSLSEKMRITWSGFVGIGYTADPTSLNKLAVNGNAYLNGGLTTTGALQIGGNINSSGNISISGYVSAAAGWYANLRTTGTEGAYNIGEALNRWGVIYGYNGDFSNTVTALGQITGASLYTSGGLTVYGETYLYSTLVTDGDINSTGNINAYDGNFGGIVTAARFNVSAVNSNMFYGVATGSATGLDITTNTGIGASIESTSGDLLRLWGNGQLRVTVANNGQIQSTITSAAPFTVANTTKVAYLNCDLLDGWHAESSVNGPAWGYIPVVKADGVMEVGRYLDFHYTSNSSVDFHNRLYLNASYQLYSSLQGTLYGSLNSNMSTVDWAAKNLAVAGTSVFTSGVTLNSTLTVAGTLTCQQQGSFVGLLIKNATGQQQLISVDANSNLVFNGNAFATGSLGAKGVAVGGFDTPPASMTAAGTVNETRWCADGIYRCIASGNWKKVAYINF